MAPQFFPWGVFAVCMLAMTALDVGVFHRKTHTVGIGGGADVERGVECGGVAVQRGRGIPLNRRAVLGKIR